MDLQQKANLRIHEEFEKRRIGFAYPTQTLYLTKP
jgi:small-conductance mechanosensitive channel